MKNKFDNILFAILWILVSILGMTFWFNSRFGFNLFYGAHWHHLAYMQASRSPIKPTFYISLVVGVFIMIYGLYLIIRPRLRKIKLPIRDTNPQPQAPIPPVAPAAPVTPATPVSENIAQPEPAQAAPATIIAPERAAPTQQATKPDLSMAPQMSNVLTRPPRLNVAPSTTPIFQPPSQQTPQQPTEQSAQPAPTAALGTPTAPTQQWSEIPEIFESAGYVIKPNIRVGNTQSAVLALGTNETIWIGAVGLETSAVQETIDKLDQIFTDILDDIKININGFVVSPRDAAAPLAPDIQIFDTISDLREFISAHPNQELTPDNQDNFEAFSTFISTVIDYLGKM